MKNSDYYWTFELILIIVRLGIAYGTFLLFRSFFLSNKRSNKKNVLNDLNKIKNKLNKISNKVNKL